VHVVVEDLNVKAAPPPGSYHLTQCADFPFGRSKLAKLVGSVEPEGDDSLEDAAEGEDGEDDKKEWELTRAGKRLWRVICIEAAKNWGNATCFVDGRRVDVLVAVQLAVKQALLQEGLPPNVHVIHFNSERGSNAYEGVKSVICAGRPRPGVAVLQAMTAAIHFNNSAVISISKAPVDSRGQPRLGRTERLIAKTGGGYWKINREAHNDPHVDEMLRSFIDDEATQSLARPRVYNRDASNPCNLLYFGQGDIGLPVDQMKRWNDFDLDVADLMAAQGVEIPDFSYAAKAHPAWVADSTAGRLAFAEAMGRLAGGRGRTNSRGGVRSLRSNLINIESIRNERSETGGSGQIPSGWVRVRVKHADLRYAGEVLVDSRRHKHPGAAALALFPGQAVEILSLSGPTVEFVPTAPEPMPASVRRRALSASAAINLAAAAMLACAIPAFADQSTMPPDAITQHPEQPTAHGAKVIPFRPEPTVNRKRGRPQSASPSKAALQKRKQRERKAADQANHNQIRRSVNA
jgi:hypothetical protein